MMHRNLIYVLLFIVVVSCGKRKDPDVSNINIDLQLQRFDQDFFSIDTANVDVSLQKLHQKYPGFLQDFVFNILALPAHPDSVGAVEKGIKEFIRSYKPIKDSSDKVFTDFSKIESVVKSGLKHVKYYFPQYKIPGKLITFIGPINSYGNIITADAFAVGLQLYMGKDYSLYQSEAGQQLYPLYISRRFEPEYIPVSTIKNIVDDMYPDNSAGLPLVEQMIEAGKRLFMLDKLMPSTDISLKTGYTKSQLEGSYDNEAFIWSFFLQNDLLFKNDPAITKDYMSDGPKTAALGEASPGFIGQFVGWQIVKKWMEKNEETKLDALMATDPKTIFEQAKYKPR